VAFAVFQVNPISATVNAGTGAENRIKERKRNWTSSAPAQLPQISRQHATPDVGRPRRYRAGAGDRRHEQVKRLMKYPD
jgi:hypothetical protein